MNLPGCGHDFLREAVVAIGGWSDGGKGGNLWPAILIVLSHHQCDAFFLHDAIFLADQEDDTHRFS